MPSEEILSKLEEIIRDLFDDYQGPVTRALSAHDVDQWDSLANVQLMVIAERTFQVRFTNDEISRLRNLGELVDLIGRRVR